MDWPLFLSFFPLLLKGLWLTVAIHLSALSSGLVIGGVVCLIKINRLPVLTWLVDFYVMLFRGTPALVQVFLIYYGLGQFEAFRDSVAWVLFREPWFCAVFALSLNSGAYTSEILRSGYIGVDRRQIEAAEAFGFSRPQIARLFFAPQMFRVCLPPYGNEAIQLLKGTSLASTISILELTGLAKKLSADHFAPFEAFIAAGLIYLAITICLTGLFQMAERRLVSEAGA